jgi:suppressor for copper-sensitivity B
MTGFIAPNLDAVNSYGLFTILGLALVGGLILNLMPCVLPVLAVKLLAVVSKGGRSRRDVRLGFLASTAGILFTFLVLGAASSAAKAAGSAVGWGVQFQQPLFLVALALLCTLFAGNLWGLFEIRLPAKLAGSIVARDRDYGFAGDFLSGVFATALATPCSAPFLGTALGFALAGGPIDIVAVFIALGIGMALPYLLVALFPGLANRLPRPGGWMITLRRILGFALLGTAAWLVSVLVVQAGSLAALSVGACLGVLLILLWAQQRLHGFRRVAALISLAIASALAFVPPDLFQARARPDQAKIAHGLWRPFDAAQIPKLVGDGHVVMVDVTADWCISCRVNETLVLDRAPVATALARDSVVAMKADWTRPSDQIAAYLASFGRYGIPFNVVYGPGAPEGILLPEILTSGAVIEALDRAIGDRGRLKQLDVGIAIDGAHLDRAIGDSGIKR